LLLLLAGCSSKGTVTGKITYQGKPLPLGIVTFVPEQGGGGFTSDIRDGEYKITKIPSGPAKIAIMLSSSGPPLKYMRMMQPPAEVLEKAAPGKSVEEPTKPSPVPQGAPLPEKFKNPDTSGLTYTVKSGSQVHDIDLPAK